jgi:hypothetical protein
MYRRIYVRVMPCNFVETESRGSKQKARGEPAVLTSESTFKPLTWERDGKSAREEPVQNQFSSSIMIHPWFSKLFFWASFIVSSHSKSLNLRFAHLAGGAVYRPTECKSKISSSWSLCTANASDQYKMNRISNRISNRIQLSIGILILSAFYPELSRIMNVFERNGVDQIRIVLLCTDQTLRSAFKYPDVKT